MTHRLTIKDLQQAFITAGMPVSKQWIIRQEYKGNLILPRSTTDFKKSQGTRKIAAVRVFTHKQIDDIVKSFLPGGTGYYDYRKFDRG